MFQHRKTAQHSSQVDDLQNVNRVCLGIYRGSQACWSDHNVWEVQKNSQGENTSVQLLICNQLNSKDVKGQKWTRKQT